MCAWKIPPPRRSNTYNRTCTTKFVQVTGQTTQPKTVAIPLLRPPCISQHTCVMPTCSAPLFRYCTKATMCTLTCTLAMFVTGYAITLLCMGCAEVIHFVLTCCHPDKQPPAGLIVILTSNLPLA